MADSESYPPGSLPSSPEPPLEHPDTTILNSTPTRAAPSTAPSTGSSDDSILTTPHVPENKDQDPLGAPLTPSHDTLAVPALSLGKTTSPPTHHRDTLDSPPSRASRPVQHAVLKIGPSLESAPTAAPGTSTDPTSAIPMSTHRTPGMNPPGSEDPTLADEAPTTIIGALETAQDPTPADIGSSSQSSSPLPSSSPLSHHDSPPPSPLSPTPPEQTTPGTSQGLEDDHKEAESTSDTPPSLSDLPDETLESPPRTPTTYLSRKRTIRQEDPGDSAEDLIEDLLSEPDEEFTPPQRDPGSPDPRVKRRRYIEGSVPEPSFNVFAPRRILPQAPSKLSKRYPPQPGSSPIQKSRRTGGTSAYNPPRKVRFITSSRLQNATSRHASHSDRPSRGGYLSTPKGNSRKAISTGTSPDSPSIPPPIVSALDQHLLLSSTDPRAVHVVQETSIKAGQTVAQCIPLHPILHTRLLESHCAGCLLDPREKAKADKLDEHVVAGRFLKCDRCEMVYFCSLKCYAKNAHSHFDECRALVKIPRIPSAEVRLLARACMDRANGRFPPKPVPLLPLTHYEMVQLGPIMRDLAAFLSRVHRASTGREHLDYKVYGFAGDVDLLMFVRRIRQHIVPITDAKGVPLGLCLAPTLSKFGHSCRPNAHVCWPYGMAIERPLRVIAIDDIDGGEEVMISHVDLSTALHQRAVQLAIKGFTHECGWCERELKTTDIRWTARHIDCPDEGLVALKDCDPQGHSDKLNTISCDACGEIDPEAGLEEYDTLLTSLEPYLQAEAEGGWLCDPVQEDKTITAELAFLEKAVDHLLNGYPDTVHPIPTLQRRLARIYLFNPDPTSEQVFRANELLQSVYDAHYLMNFEEPRHITLASLVDQVEAHRKIIEMNSYTGSTWRGIAIERADEKKRELLSSQLDRAENLIREATTESNKVFGMGSGGLVDQLRRLKHQIGRFRKWFDQNMDDGSSWEPVDEVGQTARAGKKSREKLERKFKIGMMERVLGKESKENVGRRAIGVGGSGGGALVERGSNTDEAPRRILLVPRDLEDQDAKDGVEGTAIIGEAGAVRDSPPGKRRRTY